MQTPETNRLLTVASAWASDDPDPQTRRELNALLTRARSADAAALAELADRFCGNLAFGTAGLRAALGAGPMRMNRMVVRRTASGIVRFLANRAAGSYRPKVVVGFDARYNSREFAEDSAAIFTAAGFEVYLMPSALPTPVLAWAVRNLDAEAGVMVTASHNPPEDNGYKVYVGGRVTDEEGRGAQIVAPIDSEIASLILHDEPIPEIPLATTGWTVLPGAGEPGDIEAAYLAAIASVIPSPGEDNARTRSQLRIVLSAMHGVGGHAMAQALATAGFSDTHQVAEQAAPDPDFPTVQFPNPEEPGAIDLSLALAEEVDADLVIANDPDADRCAAAVATAHGWRMLRGDEVGWLLGDYLSIRLEPEKVLANSIVSSRMLASIAAAANRAHSETLTGFKWISRVRQLGFGYEEALGYCVAPELVRDKDGISAGLVLAELASLLKEAGSSLLQRLDELAVAHGVHITDQLSLRFTDLSRIGVLMQRVRTSAPLELAGSRITEVVDLTRASADLPATDAVVLHTANRARVIVRPSGTEPKLKCYIETVAPVGPGDSLATLRQHAQNECALIKTELATFFADLPEMNTETPTI